MMKWAVSCCDMGRFVLRYGPFRTVKWAVLQCEMGRFAKRSNPHKMACRTAMHVAMAIFDFKI